MATLEISRGSAQGPAITIIVRSEGAVDWPVISGSGGPGSPAHLVVPCIMDGAGGQVPVDPRVATWPEDFTGVLRAIAAYDPHGRLFIGASAPTSGTISFACFPFEGDFVAKTATALRAAGFEVTQV